MKDKYIMATVLIITVMAFPLGVLTGNELAITTFTACFSSLLTYLGLRGGK